MKSDFVCTMAMNSDSLKKTFILNKTSSDKKNNGFHQPVKTIDEIDNSQMCCECYTRYKSNPI